MLLRLIAAVFDSMGLGEGVRPVTVTRAMRLKVLHTLRPAESALRRMIFALDMPRITIIGYDDDNRPAPIAPPPVPSDDDPMDAEKLCNRLMALKGALDDLPKQAKRMLRLKARGQRLSPLRPGLPPGWRARGRDEIDEVLRECHKLAVRAKQAPDTG